MSQTLSHNGQHYTYREMHLSDLDAVFAIEQQAQSSPWTIGDFRSSLSSSHHCCVLEYQQLIVAYAITSTAADEAELLNITVAVAHQRQGLGRLVLEVTENAFDQTIHTLFLEVRASNTAAIALYQALYFNEVGVRPNYYPAVNTSGSSKKSAQREDAIIMAKPLAL